jgi:hypothetical protein
LEKACPALLIGTWDVARNASRHGYYFRPTSIDLTISQFDGKHRFLAVPLQGSYRAYNPGKGGTHMPGKYAERLGNIRVVLTVGAVALVLIIYGFEHFFGS